ncbi:MAG: hypothetical protein F6J87_23770 [Spirulina sp. SIO3F2]|nr:hypothetical protein [Spirulina sp. SIO3F2]
MLKSQHLTPKFLGRRFLAMFCAIALPLPLVSCFNNKALLPLQAACDGEGLAEAAAYDPDATNPSIVALASHKGKTKVQGQYLAEDVTPAKTVAEAQLVACINFKEPTVVEKCTYIGAGASSIRRMGRKAEVKLVAAQTGQVLKTGLLLKEPETCPQSATFSQGQTDKTLNVDLKEFKDTLVAWIPTAIANADTSGTLTAEFLPLGQQCEVLTEAMQTDARWSGSSIEYGVINVTETDSELRVAVSMGQSNTEELLTEIADSRTALNAAPISYDQLATVKADFLENLASLEKSLTRFQELSQEAEAFANFTNGVNRQKLNPIGDETKTLAADIAEQSESMEELYKSTSSRCFDLKQMDP